MPPKKAPKKIAKPVTKKIAREESQVQNDPAPDFRVRKEGEAPWSPEIKELVDAGVDFEVIDGLQKEPGHLFYVKTAAVLREHGALPQSKKLRNAEAGR
jgi:hypothetical protein